MNSKPKCKQGTPCGDACISRGFACLDIVSEQGAEIASSLVSIAKASSMTSHFGKLYSYTDKQGKSWFVKRFASIETSCVEAEARAYTEAQKLGIAGMLVRPKFVHSSNGKMLAVWPKLEGMTLREYKAKGLPMTNTIKQGLAIAKQFDERIQNADRNLGNVWITSSGRVRLIDHDAAFSKQYSDTAAHASNMTMQEAEAIWKL